MGAEITLSFWLEKISSGCKTTTWGNRSSWSYVRRLHQPCSTRTRDWRKPYQYRRRLLLPCGSWLPKTVTDLWQTTLELEKSIVRVWLWRFVRQLIVWFIHRWLAKKYSWNNSWGHQWHSDTDSLPAPMGKWVYELQRLLFHCYMRLGGPLIWGCTEKFMREGCWEV